jgi:hypothetical protein
MGRTQARGRLCLAGPSCADGVGEVKIGPRARFVFFIYFLFPCF